MARRIVNLARRKCNMVKKLITLALTLLLINVPLAFSLEFDDNDDNIFDDQFKFDADNITAGTLGLTYGGCNINISTYEGIIAITGGACYELNSADQLEAILSLGDLFSDLADADTAGEARTTIDAQQDLDVPSEAQVEDRTSTTEYVLTPQRLSQAFADFLKDNGVAVESALTAEPANEHVGQIVLADNDNWDPAGVSGTTAYWAICTQTGTPGEWTAFLSVAGSLIVSGIDTPTLLAPELNDTSDPHTLIEAELKNKILSNSESSGADEWDFPAIAEGWNFIFIIEAAQNVTLDPNGTDQWYLNGTQMSAGEAIVNTSPTVGESIACFSTESSVYCESKYSDFAEETP
jgi:hypothetical protein